MVFVDQPKEEGQKKDCPNCEKPMIARLKTYKDNQYKPKIQWQETDETKAHYDKDGKCVKEDKKETAPESTTQHPETPVQTTITTQKIPEFEPDQKSMIEGEILILLMLNNTISNFVKQFVIDPNGGMIGQFTGIIYDKHFKANSKKASEV